MEVETGLKILGTITNLAPSLSKKQDHKLLSIFLVDEFNPLDTNPIDLKSKLLPIFYLFNRMYLRMHHALVMAVLILCVLVFQVIF